MKHRFTIFRTSVEVISVALLLLMFCRWLVMRIGQFFPVGHP